MCHFQRADATGQTMGSGEYIFGQHSSSYINLFVRTSSLTTNTLNVGSIPAGVSFFIVNGSYLVS